MLWPRILGLTKPSVGNSRLSGVFLASERNFARDERLWSAGVHSHGSALAACVWRGHLFFILVPGEGKA